MDFRAQVEAEVRRLEEQIEALRGYLALDGAVPDPPKLDMSAPPSAKKKDRKATRHKAIMAMKIGRAHV